MKFLKAKSTTKRVLWGLLSLTCLALLYYGNSHKEKRPNCNPPPVAPRVNTDGSVDHAIIVKCEGYKGRYVIIRLAADHKVRLSEAMEPTEIGGFGGPTVTLSSSTNRYVVAVFDMSNGWKPVSRSEYEKIDKNVVAEVMFSRWGNKQAKTTLERDARDIKIACEQPLQHAHGVLEYRLKKGRNPKVIPTCFKTFIDSGTARTYVSTEPFAIFDCSSPGKSGDNTGQCSGTVDTPQNVHVSVEFSTTIEPSVQQVLQAITKVTELTREAFFEYGELQIDETFSFERIPELR